MVKSVLKTVGAMAAGGIVIFALTYNSRMPEIKAGVDTLTKIAVEAQGKVTEKENEIARLAKELENIVVEKEDLQKNYDNLLIDNEQYSKRILELEATIDNIALEISRLEAELGKAEESAAYYKGEFEYVLQEYWSELDKNGVLNEELNRANKEIEKANSEQVEILDYINNAIDSVGNGSIENNEVEATVLWSGRVKFTKNVSNNVSIIYLDEKGNEIATTIQGAGLEVAAKTENGKFWYIGSDKRVYEKVVNKQ